MKTETHEEANRLLGKIKKATEHLQSIIDLIEKIESYTGTEGEHSFVGIYNQKVEIGKDNALMILSAHKSQSERDLSKLQLKYDNL